MADAAKKRKMSKADKEKMKKEEAERKAQEEEAARIRAIEEAKKQKKEEAAMAIERTKLENVERRHRRNDMTELQEILDSNETNLRNLNEARRTQAKWARYMRCDGSPDPVNQGEINTYINLRLEDESRDDAVSVLKDSQLDLSLIEELRFLMRDTPVDEISDAQREQYNETIDELEKMVAKKLDLATLQVLCDATVLADTETNNLQHVVKNDQIALCVWGNLTKNPRIKSFEFPETRFAFDIPRTLGLSDCAVRVLITKFDHFSPTSKAAIPRRKKKEEEPEPEPEVVEEEEKKEGEEGDEEKGDEEKEEEEKEETELDLMAALRGDSGEDDQKEEEQEPEEVIEEDYADPPTPEPTEWEDFDEADDIIDLRANDVLGGTYLFNLLHMPPQPKVAASWTITQLVDPRQLQFQEYVADSATEEKGKDKKDEKPLIGVTIGLPEDVLFLEEPQIARWDHKRKFWSTDGFSDLNFNEDARQFSFKTNQFGTMCLLQDTHINMPFQSWEIRPHKLNCAVLTIIAAIVEIEIEIRDALCCLSQPKDKPELESIRNKWVTPSELIMMMKNAGVNVFPNEDSSKFVSIQNKTPDKHPLIEDRIYQQMALTASSMAYSWSKWNGEREREEIVFQGAEALEDEPLLEEDWSVYLATKRRVMKLKMTEFDEEFSDAHDGEGELLSAPIHKKKSGRSPLSETPTGIKVSHGSDTRTTISSSQSTVSSQASFFGKASSGVSQRQGASPGKMKQPVHSVVLEEDEVAENQLPTDPLYRRFDVENSPYKSNIYHLMKDVASEAARDRVQETNFQFVDCVQQLLKATKVLTYA